MEIIKKQINGKQYEFVCEYWETRNSWGHKATLLCEGVPYELHSTKVRYYNRTWEEYRFQSVMQILLDELRKERKERIVNYWKYDNNKSRCSKEQKETLWANDEKLEEYNQLYNSL